MGENILSNCGKYSDDLSKIAKTIIEQDFKNNKNLSITKKVTETQYEVFEAYQQILKNATNSNAIGSVISESIKRLSETVKLGENFDNLKNVAGIISKNVVMEANYNFEKDDQNTAEDVVATAVIAGNLKNEKNSVNKIYNLQLQNDINSLYDKAQNGDEETIAKVNEIEKITVLANNTPTLDEKMRRGVLARMIRLASIDDETCKEVVIQIANNYGIDIFSVNEKGEKILDLEKLEETFQICVAEVNLSVAKMTIEEFGKLVEKSAKDEKDKGTYSKPGRNIQGAVLEGERSRELIEFEQQVNKAFRNNDIQAVEKLVEDKSDLAALMIQDLSKWSQNEKISKEVANSLKNRSTTIESMIRKKQQSQDNMVKDMELEI